MLDKKRGGGGGGSECSTGGKNSGVCRGRQITRHEENGL